MTSRNGVLDLDPDLRGILVAEIDSLTKKKRVDFPERGKCFVKKLKQVFRLEVGKGIAKSRRERF